LPSAVPSQCWAKPIQQVPRPEPGGGIMFSAAARSTAHRSAGRLRSPPAPVRDEDVELRVVQQVGRDARARPANFSKRALAWSESVKQRRSLTTTKHR
jgi:hypothetical protein